MSALLEEAGRPVPPLGLSRMIKAERRVDVDELVALAAVLGVTPDVLLAPPGDSDGDHAAIDAARQLAARIGGLLVAQGDAETQEAVEDLDRALRRVQLEAEELLADVRRETRQRGRKSA